MNKFVLSALAVSAVGTLAHAGTEAEEWSTLDREIENLATSLAQPTAGFHVSGFVKTSYASSGDVDFPSVSGGPGGTSDLGGFSLDNAAIYLEGSIGDYQVYIHADGSSEADASGGFPFAPFSNFGPLGSVGNPGGRLLDAYVGANITDQIRAQAGNFRPPFLGGALIEENHLLFIDRTFNAEIWDFRDLGLMFNGQFEQVGWWIAAQNGADLQGDELAFAARIAFNALGTGAGQTMEGAYGASEDSNLTIAAGYYTDDDNVSDAVAWTLEADFTRGAFSAAAELVDYDDGIGFVLPGSGAPETNVTPWAVTLGWMLSPDTWEVAARFEDFDDSNDSTMVLLGVNYYMEGHDSKLQLNYSTIDSDSSFNEIDVIALAWTVGV